jgi:hypothetical protein
MGLAVVLRDRVGTDDDLQAVLGGDELTEGLQDAGMVDNQPPGQ